MKSITLRNAKLFVTAKRVDGLMSESPFNL